MQSRLVVTFPPSNYKVVGEIGIYLPALNYNLGVYLGSKEHGKAFNRMCHKSATLTLLI